ncbi:hypothetical protein SAMN05192534_109109 [Alteribacillus persepolensis]|uniref:Uncharacterized protein n=1 Tax=Alteribacillus persepolensis TaxID=568899 RepID=A0A1G8EI93_9BACI|nr:hypothetical protein [Alteribacillus persepolensis]SDH69587.1 hypothetical protein SAMN05192534_109109 [Alteribacillus persepolensis]
MDGLELILKAKEFHPQLYTIVISGYDDFKYANPVLLPMFTGVLEKIKMDFIQTKRDRMYVLQLEEAHQIYQSMTFKAFIRDIMYKYITEDTVNLEKSKFQYQDDSLNYVVMVAQLADVENEMTDLQKLKIKVFHETLNQVIHDQNLIGFPNDNCEYVICLPDKNPQRLERKVTDFINEYHARSKGKSPITFSVGRMYSDFVFGKSKMALPPFW